ncbi:MAG: hypothetical protein A2Z96_04260 [Spirochaetes bacterium GWB1_48_6]|nr:MAG: hypothetical protein A2Z96_04260 [Spirochaetes bacterium GWB1_48_6]
MKKLGLRVQHLLAQISIPFTFGLSIFFMKGLMGYRWVDLKGARDKIRSQIGAKPGPLMICPNHLTMIDSLILVWAITPFWKAMGKARMFPWNTPEKTNYAHVAILRFFTYIGKCLPVVRQGPQEKTRTLMYKIKLLLTWSQSLMMFPEGARSLTGRVDTENYAYGVGKILDDVRQEGLEPRVLLMYLRGKGQKGKSTLPKRNEEFYLDSQLIDPRSKSTGLRASRDISKQIIDGLAEMERIYFKNNEGMEPLIP